MANKNNKDKDNSGIQLRDLEYLVALSRYNHFGRAAADCNVSQPTISGQVRKLEEKLGLRLVERSSRRVIFTKSGITLVEQARKVLNSIRVMKEMAMQLSNDMSGSLHIGLIPTLGPYVTNVLIKTFAQEFPDLDVYFYEKQTDQLLADLELGQIDFAILAKVSETEYFATIDLVSEPLKLLVNKDHPIAKLKKNNSINIKELAGQKVYLLNEGHCLRDQTLDLCAVHNLIEDSKFMTSSLETLRYMVKENIGITFMPVTSIRDPIMIQGMEVLTINPEPQRKLEVVYRPASPLKSRYENCARLIKRCFKSIIDVPLTNKQSD